MPKRPDKKPGKTSKLRLFGALGVGLLAGVMGIHLWSPSQHAQVGGQDSRDSVAAAESFGAREPDDPIPGIQVDRAADAPRPGSMQENLLNTTDADRNQLFRRAIADVGFVCSDVKDASAVGSSGSAWRTDCGDTNLYFIEVGEYGRLSIVPMLFNDSLAPRVPRQQFTERE